MILPVGKARGSDFDGCNSGATTRQDTFDTSRALAASPERSPELRICVNTMSRLNLLGSCVSKRVSKQPHRQLTTVTCLTLSEFGFMHRMNCGCCIRRHHVRLSGHILPKPHTVDVMVLINCESCLEN